MAKIIIGKESDCRLSLWIDGILIHNEIGITPEHALKLANDGPFVDEGNEAILDEA